MKENNLYSMFLFMYFYVFVFTVTQSHTYCIDTVMKVSLSVQ